MQWDHSDSFLAAGFNVVREIVPETFARMDAASDWAVTTDIDAYLRLQIKYSGQPGIGDLMLLAEANGTTAPVGALCASCAGVTLINPAAIRDWSDETGLHVASATAAGLVHEFSHLHNDVATPDHTAGERAAFLAQYEFGKLLRGRDGAVITDDVLGNLRKIAQHEYPHT